MKKIGYLFILFVGCSTEKDKSMLVNTPFSPTVVHVNFVNDPADTVVVNATVDTIIPKEVSVSSYLTVATAGDYYLNMEVDRPAKSVLNLGREQFNVFVFPFDTTHIKVTTRDFELNFYGTTSPLNEYYLAKKKKLGYTDIRFPFRKLITPKTTYNSLKQTTDSVINQEILFFQEYTATHTLPEWFANYEQSEITYTQAGYKTAMPHLNEILHHFADTLPANYYDFLSNTEIDNPKAVLSPQYFSFLDDYFLKDLPVNEFSQLQGSFRKSKIKSHQLVQSKNQLSGQIRELYHKSGFISMLTYYEDSVAIDSLAKAFEVSNYRESVRMARVKPIREGKMPRLKVGNAIPEFILSDDLDSLISLYAFRDKILYLNFWAHWCGPCIANIPELNKLISHYEEDDRVEFVNISIDPGKEKWLASIKRHKLKGLNLIVQGKWWSKLAGSFDIQAIPHYIIINKGGILYENATDKAPIVQKKIDALLMTGKLP